MYDIEKKDWMDKWIHYVGEKESDKEERQRQINHARRVCNICERIVGCLDDEWRWEIDIELLYKAAILHDIGKWEEEERKKGRKNNEKKEKHNKLAAGVLESLNIRGDELFEIIRVHRKKFNPPLEVAAEAAILRMADKIDKLYKETGGRKEFEENLKAVKKYFNEGWKKEWEEKWEEKWEVEWEVALEEKWEKEWEEWEEKWEKKRKKKELKETYGAIEKACDRVFREVREEVENRK